MNVVSLYGVTGDASLLLSGHSAHLHTLYFVFLSTIVVDQQDKLSFYLFLRSASSVGES
jgi:hypothetical protein